MSRRERVLVWLVLLATTLFLLAVLQDVMLPFVVGMAIAYFLDPVVDRFETWRFGRGLATFVVLLLFQLSLATLGKVSQRVLPRVFPL